MDFLHSIFFSGEELWIGAVKPRPQKWPGGYSGDLGETIAARTKWLRPTKDTGGGGGGRYERQR